MKALLLLLVVPACAHLRHEGEPPGLSVTTDRREYLAEPYLNARPWKTYMFRAQVVMTFKNTSSATVYLDQCSRDGKPLFELDTPTTGGSWHDRGTMWMCGDAGPIEVGVGKTLIDTLTIDGPNGRSSSGELLGRLGGTYRIGLIARGCETGRCALLDSLRFSNSFTVREATGIPPTEGSVAGCYKLNYLEWDDAPSKPAVPAKFRLYRAKENQTPRARPLLPLGDSSLAMWMPITPDSIVVTWRSELSGYRLHLRPDGGYLFGALENFGISKVDIMNFRRPAKLTNAVARRVECDRTFDFH